MVIARWMWLHKTAMCVWRVTYLAIKRNASTTFVVSRVVTTAAVSR